MTPEPQAPHRFPAPRRVEAALPDGAEDRAHEAALKMAIRLKGKMTAMEATVWRREA